MPTYIPNDLRLSSSLCTECCITTCQRKSTVSALCCPSCWLHLGRSGFGRGDSRPTKISITETKPPFFPAQVAVQWWQVLNHGLRRKSIQPQEKCHAPAIICRSSRKFWKYQGFFGVFFFPTLNKNVERVVVDKSVPQTPRTSRVLSELFIFYS